MIGPSPARYDRAAAACELAVRRERVAADKRVALVSAAARRQDKIRSMLGKINEEQGEYETEYRLAMEAWSKPELDGFACWHLIKWPKRPLLQGH